LNTIPGFHLHQHVPEIVAGKRLTYAQLVDRLIELALERKAQRDRTERIGGWHERKTQP
jgi:D-alanine-D-alanine ligase